MLSGDNGILRKATDAQTFTERASVVEQAKTDVLGYQAENKGTDLQKSQLQSVLETYFKSVPDLTNMSDIEILNTKLETLAKYGNHNITVKEIFDGKFTSSNEIAIVEGNPAEWETNESGDTLTKYLGSSKNIVIPNRLNGKEITTIGSLIFAGSSIETLEISDGIETIEARAFVSSRNLIGSLIIPNTVKTIGDAAFAACTFDQKLVVPNSVETIGKDVFATIPFSDVEIDMTNIPNEILSSQTTSVPVTGKLILGQNVKIIEEGAFAYCTNMTGTLTIGPNVTSIGKDAFRACRGLTGNLNIPDSVITIGEHAFSDCSELTGIPHISANIETIGECVFFNCKNLTGNLILGTKLKTIGMSAFQYCKSFESITVPSTVESVGNGSFDDVAHIYYTGLLDTSNWGAKAYN